MGAAAVFADVTREQALPRGVAASEERLRRVYGAMACGVIVLDATGGVEEVNAAARQILGLAAGAPVDIWAVRGRVTTVWDAAPSPPRTALDVLGLRYAARDVVVGYRHPDGTERLLRLDVVPVPGADAGDAPSLTVLSFIDVTDRVRAEAALRVSEERVRTVVSNAPVVLFALDRNGVFTLMEGRGLAALGWRAGETVGASAFDLYRSHPEILAHLRRALDGEAHTGVVALEGVFFEARYTPLHDADGTVTGVIGVATDITERQRMEEELRRQATHDALTDLPNRALLRERLAEGTLALHYQPQLDLRTGRVVGVEALARWPHPARGFVPPDQFIPLAEAMGLIGPLTNWVLETAIAQCRAWREADRALTVAVNISAATLHDPRLPETIERLLGAHGVAGGDLRLEVTESAFMADPARAGVVMRLACSMRTCAGRPRARGGGPRAPRGDRPGPLGGRLWDGLLLAGLPQTPADGRRTGDLAAPARHTAPRRRGTFDGWTLRGEGRVSCRRRAPYSGTAARCTVAGRATDLKTMA